MPDQKDGFYQIKLNDASSELCKLSTLFALDIFKYIMKEILVIDIEKI